MDLLDHLEKINYFYKLHGFKSIKEASSVLGISQSGLSKNIDVLEKALDIKLIVRTRQGIHFTPAGIKFYQFSHEMIANTLRMQSEIKRTGLAQQKFEIVLGTYDSIAVYFLPELLNYLKQVYENVRITIRVDKSQSLQKMIEEGKADVVIGVNLKPLSDKVISETLFSDSYGFFYSSKIDRDQGDLPLLLHPLASDFNGKTCGEYLAKIAKTARTIQSDNFETIKSMTIRGLGIGALPRNVAAPELRQGRLVQTEWPGMPQLFGPHRIVLCYRSGLKSKLSPFLSDLVRIGRSWSFVG